MLRARFSFTLFVAILLLAACGGGGEEFETFSFTAEDAEEISALLDQIEGTEATPLRQGFEGQAEGVIDVGEVVLDASEAHRFDALRTSVGSLGDDTFRVTNAFLNVRESPSVGAEKVDELKLGDHVTLLSFPNAAWAHIALPNGRKGYVSTSYIAQVTTEEKLPEIKKRYEGQYYVNFAFLNVRATPSTQAQKLGELTSNQIIIPLAFHEDWARFSFEGKEGYVSSKYLRPFAPSVIVRQETFQLPILRYRGDEAQIADVLVKHLALLQSAGKRLITIRDFYDILKTQDERDVRLSPDSVLIAISDLTPTTIKDISDVLRATGVRATFFLQTSDIGPDGISPSTIRTVIANGNDIQSAGHSGDDLRALTNTQITLDLGQSRQILEDLTGKDVFAIAYPGGGVNDRIAEKAIETGYLFGVTLEPGSEFSRSQFLRLPANLISPTTPEQTLKGLVGIIE